MAIETKPAPDASHTSTNGTTPADASDGHGGHPPLAVADRRARGRALRTKLPRSSHAFWAESASRLDPISLLEAQEKTRLPDLVPVRHARMRVSAFAFYRGSAVVMAGDLVHTPTTGLATQLCGDAHLANFGLYASPERTLLFDITDFDETLPGPWEWDVKRLATSVFLAGRNNGFTDAECRDATLAAVRSYRRRMAGFAEMGDLEIWYARVTADDVLGLIEDQRTQRRMQQQLSKIRQHTSLQALSKLTVVKDGQRVIASDPPLVVRVTAGDESEVIRGVFRKYLKTLRGAQRHLLERYRIVDVARKVVGVGSVGTRCYILLLAGRHDDDPLFLQAKEAEPSVLEAHLSKSGLVQQGERVVAGQELMQAASDITLGWVRGPAGRDFYVRQLRDMKGSAQIETLRPSQLARWADACGWALARAHARAGDAVQIAAYLGTSAIFDRAVAAFASAYADQVERDYQAFLAAIKTGRVVAAASS